MQFVKYTIGFLVISMSIVACIVALVVMWLIGAMAFKAIESGTDKEFTQVFLNWGGMIVGFLFGTLSGIIKDWMRLIERSQITKMQAEVGEETALRTAMEN